MVGGIVFRLLAACMYSCCKLTIYIYYIMERTTLGPPPIVPGVWCFIVRRTPYLNLPLEVSALGCKYM